MLKYWSVKFKIGTCKPYYHTVWYLYMLTAS